MSKQNNYTYFVIAIVQARKDRNDLPGKINYLCKTYELLTIN